MILLGGWALVEDRVAAWANAKIDERAQEATEWWLKFLSADLFPVIAWLILVGTVLIVGIVGVVLLSIPRRPLIRTGGTTNEEPTLPQSQPTGFPRPDEIHTVSQVALSPSTRRVTIVTPSPGRIVRVFGYTAFTEADVVEVQIYFGTNANYDTHPGKQIDGFLLGKSEPNRTREFPEDGRPRGYVDDVVSFRTARDVGNGVRLTIRYKEE